MRFLILFCLMSIFFLQSNSYAQGSNPKLENKCAQLSTLLFKRYYAHPAVGILDVNCGRRQSKIICDLTTERRDSFGFHKSNIDVIVELNASCTRVTSHYEWDVE